ncbi:hypothetical protein [Flagellimonas sp.]|uniref:hypothetical protein n=1 Tax=Flagellimonas sp. TaxID=2058762 RepID=UPI003F49DF3E
MATVDLTRVTGFTELNEKLKKLDDSAKRREVLGLLRKQARPAIVEYRNQLPDAGGTTRRSVGAKTVPRRRSRGNPAIVVAPGKRGRNDAYYRFMIIKKGDRPGSTRRGSRQGLTTVVPGARDRTLVNVRGTIAKSSEIAMARYIQGKIDKLSLVQ